MTIEITDETINDVIANNDAVLIDFWAEFCTPCKMMLPIVNSLGEVNQGVVIAKLDVSKNPESMAKYGVRGIPAFLFFSGGELVHREVGGRSKNILQDLINSKLL